jgi:hypothetical protein
LGMQDELTKHGLKIYKTMKDRKHSLGEKLKEIIIEIGIIVFAVTLSIWLHSWSESRHEQKEVKEFLKGLKGDLADDIRQMTESHELFGKVHDGFSRAYHLKKGELPDSVLKHLFYYNILVTQHNTARYEGFKSSSKLGLIEEDSLRQNILVYYQQLVPAISYNENFVNQLEQQLLDFNIDKSNLPINEFLDLPKTRSLLQLTAENIHNCMGRYDTAIRKANIVIQQIDHEISR